MMKTLLYAALLSSTLTASEKPLPEKVQFNRDIQPILSDTCFTCHGPSKPARKGDLRLDRPDDLFDKRDDYHIIIRGKPEESELIRRISRTGRGQMPPRSSGRKLTSRQIELLKRWVKQGAQWQKHWAFLPPKRASIPVVKKKSWPRQPLDSFILARLESEELEPSPETSRETWIRRVTLDLIGLPPTLAEIDNFVDDSSPNAFEKVVDRLLASPRYGEHHASSWLDAARYADTNGYQQDRTRTMWPWKDWLIRALNHNMPFDQFTIEQMAGDLLPGATVSQKVATGFHRNHMLNGEGGRIAEESRVEYVIDRLDTTSTVWLGLTMACSRCHDHKYDPISQEEFYRFYAYFNSIDERGNVDRGGNANPVIRVPTPEQIAKRERLRAQIKVAKKEDIPRLKKSLQNLEKSFVETMVMRERAKPRDTYLLQRGQWDKPDKSVKLMPGAPAAFSSKKKIANRLDLARWMVSDDNPLTARVTVNRYWQHFFGQGLVKTVEDFGSQGARPSHPDLLDWLAIEFVHSNWNVKALHRSIVLSSTYRQSSKLTRKLLERDPQNQLLARSPRYRLSSSMLRDQALALSGLLVNKIGGPPVKPYQPKGVWREMTLGKIGYKRDTGEKLYRRSVYTFWRRSVGPTMLFDSSARQVCTVRASRTNTPLHALTLMNDITYVEASRALAQNLLQRRSTLQERLSQAFRLATGRKVRSAELATLEKVYQKTRQRYQQDQEAAKKLIAVGELPIPSPVNAVELASLTAVVNMILNLDEVLTRE